MQYKFHWNLLNIQKCNGPFTIQIETERQFLLYSQPCPLSSQAILAFVPLCIAMSGVCRNINPSPPHRPASVYPPAFDAGGGHTRWVERGWGSLIRKTPDTAL
jgi:hypothetical protein